MKKLLLLILITLICCSSALGEDAQRVFHVGDAPEFSRDAELLQVYVCPLGGADCTILMVPGQCMMVDMGKSTDMPVIQAMLDWLGISHIDIAFNSHPHSDHIGSTHSLLQSCTFGMFMTAYPEDYKGDGVYQIGAMNALREAHVPIQHVDNGDAFSLGPANCTVMRRDISNPNVNQTSAMLMVQYGECRLLLTADVFGIALQHLAEEYDVKADIMKYPHHGIDTIPPVFIQEVAPEFAFLTHATRGSEKGQQSLYWFGVPYDFATEGILHFTSNGEYWLIERLPYSLLNI